MGTEYAAVPCDSLIPAFSFPIEDKIVIKIFEKKQFVYIFNGFIRSIELFIISHIFISFIFPPYTISSYVIRK